MPERATPAARRDKFASRSADRVRLPRWGFLVGLWVAAVLILGPAGHTRAATSEAAVKAACLVQFAHYVQWPAGAFPAADAPLTIGILGDDPFGGVLDQLVQGDVVGSEKRKIVVKRSDKLANLKTCNILFVSKSEAGQVPQILNELGQGAVLTVGETEGFARRGGIFNFFLVGDKVRFEINNDVAVSRGLKIDPRLLKLAPIIHS